MHGRMACHLQLAAAGTCRQCRWCSAVACRQRHKLRLSLAKSYSNSLLPCTIESPDAIHEWLSSGFTPRVARECIAAIYSCYLGGWHLACKKQERLRMLCTLKCTPYFCACHLCYIHTVLLSSSRSACERFSRTAGLIAGGGLQWHSGVASQRTSLQGNRQKMCLTLLC